MTCPVIQSLSCEGGAYDRSMATALAVASLLVVVAAACVLVVAVVRRRNRWGEGQYPRLDPTGQEGGEPGGLTGVREPRRPVPSSGSAAAQVDPDDQAA